MVIEAQLAQRSSDGIDARPTFVGMALGSSAMPASLLTVLTGFLFLQGHDALAFGIGLMAGLVAATVLVASRIQASGAATIPAYLEARFGTPVSMLGTAVLVAVAFLMLLAEFSLAGLAAERGLGLPYASAVAAIALAVGATAVISGTRALTPLQAAFYAVLALGLVAVLVLVAVPLQGMVMPHFSYGDALQEIGGAERRLLEEGLADLRSFRAHAKPFLDLDQLNFLALFVTLMTGMAALPHIVTRFASQPSQHASRLAGAYAALFVLVLLITLPALAAFAKLAVFNLILAPTSFAALPDWLRQASELDLVRFHGASLGVFQDVLSAVMSGHTDVAAVTSTLKSQGAATIDTWIALKAPAKAAMVEQAKHIATASGVDAWETFKASVMPAVAAVSGNKTGALTHGGLDIDAGAVMFLLPGLTTVPALAKGLLVAALIAGAFSTSAGLAATLGGVLQGNTRAAHLGMGVTILLAGVVAIVWPADLMATVMAAFSVAAAGLFPALVLGLWWRRTNSWGAAAGLIAGVSVTVFYLAGAHFFPTTFYETWAELSNCSDAAARKFASLKAAWENAKTDEAKAVALAALEAHAHGIANWFGIQSTSAAVFGVPLGLVVMMLVSGCTPRRAAR